MSKPHRQDRSTGLHGDLDQPKLEMIAQQLLANDVIQIFEIWRGE